MQNLKKHVQFVSNSITPNTLHTHATPQNEGEIKNTIGLLQNMINRTMATSQASKEA